MARRADLLDDDTNQFGPGTDLIAAILSVLLVMTLVSSYLYSQAQREQDQGGDFRLAEQSFSAGTFYPMPPTALRNPAATEQSVKAIVEDYRRSVGDFPYLFVVGHANELDDPRAADQTRAARLRRNWEFGVRRAAVIAARLEQYLTAAERERLVVMTTGELDLRNPQSPISQENAWVEVVFGRVWKPPSRTRSAVAAPVE